MRNLQGRRLSRRNEYEVIEDYILEEAHVSCSVFVGPTFVSLRTADARDYRLAKWALLHKPGFDKEVRHDLGPTPERKLDSGHPRVI